MKSFIIATLILACAAAASAKPADDLTIPNIDTIVRSCQPKTQTPKPLTPLVWDYRRAEIEAMAVSALRNGIEDEYIKSQIIRTEAAKSPTRSYKYAELDKLVSAIYSSARTKVGNTVIVRGVK